MLAIKYTPSIFLISVYISLLQQDIWYVTVGLFKNWKQFLSVTYSVFIGAGVRHLRILILDLYIQEVPTKHPREKNLKPRKNDGTLVREPRYHETHGI